MAVSDAEPAQEIEGPEVARGTIYGVLASLYEEPTTDLHAALETGALFEELDELLKEAALAVAVPATTTADDYELLCARFNDLFAVGYPDPPIPRYESAHVERTWDQVNLDLTRLYQYFDVAVDQDDREHHDALVVELEFAGYLARLAATGEPDAKRARADFLDRHLLPFVESIESALAEERGVGIYADVTTFAVQFLQADRQQLREALDETTA
jgi:DMSO reductase family type II enzyme chaperone